MSVVLKHQIEASEKSAQELESLVYAQAGLCREVEALMGQIVNIFDEINEYVEGWQTDIEHEKIRYNEQTARSMFELYVRLEKTAQKAAHLGQYMESLGFNLDRKARFVNTWRKLKGIICFSADRVAESMDQIRRGDFKSLGEFADELSRDLGQECTG